MTPEARLRDLLAAVPDDRKSQLQVEEHDVLGRHSRVYFGPPPEQNRAPLGGALPPDTRYVAFLGAPDQPELVRAVVDSHHAQDLLALFVGNFSYAHKGYSLDYSPSVASLRGAELPNLRYLQLGEWERFHNSETLYGTIGDVTDVLANLDELVYLQLAGTFELTRSRSFDHLVELELWSLSTIAEPCGDPIDPASFANALACEMPALEEAMLHPYCELERVREAFPRAFLDGENVPRLRKVEVAGEDIDAEALGVLLDSPLFARPGFVAFIEDIPDLPDLDELRRRYAQRPGWRWKVDEASGEHSLRVVGPAAE